MDEKATYEMFHEDYEIQAKMTAIILTEGVI
jgi:hypothetical protein